MTFIVLTTFATIFFGMLVPLLAEFILGMIDYYRDHW